MKGFYLQKRLTLAVLCLSGGLGGQTLALLAQTAPSPASPTARAGEPPGQTAPAKQPPPLPPLPSPPPVRPAYRVQTSPVVISPVIPGAPPIATVPPAPSTSSPSPTPVRQAPTIVPNTILAWDAEKKQYFAKATEANAHFTFHLTNVSSSDVMINSVRTSCGCTAAKLPQTPWRIAPGQGGPIEVDMNIAGKRGVIPKSVTVDTSVGMKYLTVESHIAELSVTDTASMGERERNQFLAKADPLAIFKGDCAKCHVEPTVGKMGRELYVSACAICHNAEHRAAMVPDLQDKYRIPMPAEFWNLFITMGKAGSLMPTFAKEGGGILSKEQIASLVEYLVSDFPKETKIVYHDPRGPSAPAPLAVPGPQAKPVTNSPSAALPTGSSPSPNASVFPVQKVQ
jgi:hypothetical protein